jgi:hypothetical protein
MARAVPPPALVAGGAAWLAQAAQAGLANPRLIFFPAHNLYC